MIRVEKASRGKLMGYLMGLVFEVLGVSFIHLLLVWILRELEVCVGFYGGFG